MKKLNSIFSLLFQSQIGHPLLPFLFLTTGNRDDSNQFFHDHLQLIASDELKMQSTLRLYIAKCWKPWLTWSGAQKVIKEIGHGEGRGGEGKAEKKPLTEKKIFLYSCSSVYKILLKMRGQWIQIAENKILVKCGLPYFLMSLSFVFGVKRFINCVASA